MSEEREQQSRNQPNDASKEATKTAAKGAANAYLGPLGGKAVDELSKTKLGDAVLTKGAQSLERRPFGKTMANMAQKSGALDAANRAMDSQAGGSAPKSSGSAPNSSMSLEDPEAKKGNSNLFNSFKNNQNSNEELDGIGEVDATTKLVDFAKKHWIKILIPILGLLLVIIIIFIIMTVVISPAQTVLDFFREAWDKMVTFVTGDKSTQEWELEYYQKLDEVQENLGKKYGVCIDVNLITATLTVDVANDEYIDEGKDPETDTPDGSELGLSGEDYKKMIKHVELLGNMQIKRTIYGLDKEVLEANIEKANGQKAGPDKVINPQEDYCAEEATEYDYPLHYGGTSGEDNLERKLEFVYKVANYNFFDPLGLRQKLLEVTELAGSKVAGIPVRDSSTPRLLASNDIDPGLWKFMEKKANEERNIQYKFYVPAYTYIEVKDKDGNVIRKDKKCIPSVPTDAHDFAKLDIGSLNDMENNIYYWNLMDSFIADYYEDYLPKVSGPVAVGSEKYEKIKDIIEDIYLLYHEMGPNQSCESDSYICRSDEGADYYGGGETSLTRDEFITNTSPLAIEEMTRTGIAASITLAQAAIESNNGASGLSTKYSNYYGMTAGSCAPNVAPSGFVGVVYNTGEGGNECQGNAFWNGTVVSMCNSKGTDCQWYRVYDSFANSTRDHSRLLSESYGCNVGSYEEQLDCIVDHGYATDPNYKSTIKSMIQKYNLDQYDIGTFSGTLVEVTDPQYTSRICNSLGVATGDWAGWKQYYDLWSGTALGPSTVGKIGCAMTSVAMQIMRSGVSTTLGSNFDPGTFAEALAAIGGFDSRGNIYWDKVTEIAPNFKTAGRNYGKVSASNISDLVNNGYYVILNVKNGNHWVAVDRVEGNKIYMFDPGSGGTEVGQTYGLDSIVGYQLYKVE